MCDAGWQGACGAIARVAHLDGRAGNRRGHEARGQRESTSDGVLEGGEGHGSTGDYRIEELRSEQSQVEKVCKSGVKKQICESSGILSNFRLIGLLITKRLV